MITKIKKWLKQFAFFQILNAKRIVAINRRRQKKILQPKENLIKKYEKYYNHKPDLTNPTRFSEFLLWQKLYLYKPEATLLTDKITAKEYVKKLIGTEITYPKTYATFDNAFEISLSNLPNKSVIKCNHNNGYIFYVEKKSDKDYFIKNLKDTSKKNYNFRTMQKLLNEMLKINFHYFHFEWNYKNIAPKILVEEYLEAPDLCDYKFLMNYDKLMVFYINSGRQFFERMDFFDADLKPLQISEAFPPSNNPPELPNNILKMIEIAKKISKDYPFLRVDLYTLNEKIYFGEATFFHFAGWLRFKYPENYDKWMGSKMKIKPEHMSNNINHK